VPTIEDDNGRRWRLMALETFALASCMTDPQRRATMLRIAAGYDHLAELEEKEAEPSPTKH
jgi:hypothetical protein